MIFFFCYCFQTIIHTGVLTLECINIEIFRILTLEYNKLLFVIDDPNLLLWLKNLKAFFLGIMFTI